ncbi:MAG: tRNA (adenosine(37)-N6)-threonylcarbamoyltransferase complex dimerization subunit type 1 TsaB [Acidobacteria bacterium]|nr:tRNA (adenosine(37)-N6)-threonylcarbamoyltransferase complex dimerization subunit type 1 TsaB [Acidobacteriota bacterium]
MNVRALALDTCGETATVCLSEGEHIVASDDLDRGRASARIVTAISRLLAQMDWVLADLDIVGVVSGPGSFTGVRAGIATAKGLCEAAGLPLVAVSRLEVLSDAVGLRDGFAVLDAGRGEVFVRDAATGREWLTGGPENVPSGKLAVAESRTKESLAGRDVVLRPLGAGDALATILRTWRGDSLLDVACIDANYVRGESDIYRKQTVV